MLFNDTSETQSRFYVRQLTSCLHALLAADMIFNDTSETQSRFYLRQFVSAAAVRRQNMKGKRLLLVISGVACPPFLFCVCFPSQKSYQWPSTLLYMCPDTAVYASSYYYKSVLVLL
jgi:hypothetical protein